MGLFRLAFYGLVFAFVVYVILELDINKIQHSHKPGPCRHIKGIKDGSEDLVVLNSGHALLTSGAYLPTRNMSKIKGQIFIMDLSDPQPLTNPTATPLKLLNFPNAVQEFYPAGLSAWESGLKKPLVYVINIKSGVVHVFELDLSQKSLTLTKTIKDEENFHALNNLVLVGPQQFYATNFMRFKSLLFLEAGLEVPLGSIVYYDGKKAQKVQNYLPGPNGVAVSKDQKFLFVAMHYAEALYVYRINSNNHSLHYENSLDLQSHLDNVNVDADGAIWIGSHPIKYLMALHIIDVRRPSPSQVFKASYDGSKNKFTEIQEIYADPGTELSGSSVAQRYGTSLLIGTVTERALICELRHH